MYIYNMYNIDTHTRICSILAFKQSRVVYTSSRNPRIAASPALSGTPSKQSPKPCA